MNEKELKSIFEDLMPHEAMQMEMAKVLKDLQKKTDKIIENTEKSFEERQNQVAKVLEEVIKSIDQYLLDLQKQIDGKIKLLDLSIKEAQVSSKNRSDSIDSELGKAKKEMGEHTKVLIERINEAKVHLIGIFENKYGEIKDYSERVEKDLKQNIESLKKDFNSEITKKVNPLFLRVGGGQVPRKWSLNGTEIAKKYADFNIIATGWSAADNNTSKRTDITVQGGGIPVYGEVPSGSGTSFTLAHTPSGGTIALYRGGARQQAGAGNDYTLSGTTITLAVALGSGEILLADYQY